MKWVTRRGLRSGRWLALAVIVLAAGATAPGATSGTGKTPTALLDRLDALWSNGDVRAFGSVYGRGAVVSYYTPGLKYNGRSEIIDELRAAHSCKYTLKRVAPIIVNGQFAVTFKTVGGGCSGAGVTFMTVYQIQHGKVMRDWHLLPGTSPPLDEVAPQ
jgi:hypothetical protein